jgi:hypothetical protein
MASRDGADAIPFRGVAQGFLQTKERVSGAAKMHL